MVPFPSECRERKVKIPRGSAAEQAAIAAWVQGSALGYRHLSLLGFDCCTPLILELNEEIPGIAFNIARLREIGEPYLFGR